MDMDAERFDIVNDDPNDYNRQFNKKIEIEKKRQSLKRIERFDKYIENMNIIINNYQEQKIKEMLEVADFVNSGSDKKNEISEKFNNCNFSNVLENMALEKKIKKITKKKLNKKNEYSYKHYYYLRLSDTEVENMSESDIKLRLWQKKY